MSRFEVNFETFSKRNFPALIFFWIGVFHILLVVVIRRAEIGDLFLDKMKVYVICFAERFRFCWKLWSFRLEDGIIEDFV